ncbi:MAG: helix-turn-helix domain-containing protein [Bacteroidota bacterium]
MDLKFRCSCPVTSALDVLGDRWSLVIVKLMLLDGSKTFKDFSASEEAIATNILSSRLKMLEELHLISKEKLPHNKKTNIYRLTEKGLGLTPVIVDLILWSDTYLREYHPEMDANETLDAIKNDREGAIQNLQQNYRENIGVAPKKN